MTPLPRDLDALVRRVTSSVERLLAQQDRDADAPTAGCFHPAHWRDKSASFADMRRQEAVLPLALMWRYEFPGNVCRGESRLLESALLGLRYWCATQHDDGTFDEWYVREHGYATTAFSTFAVALTVDTLGDALADPLRADVLRALRKSADWLATHDDWFKTNHEAVGVAALGVAAKTLADSKYAARARHNAACLSSRQHSEGWSEEVTSVDVGYSFLLAEYLGLHAVLCGEPDSLAPARRALKFAAHFLHPNMTTSADYGICANPYVSRLAAVALAPHDATAAAMVRWMQRVEGTEPTSTLEDDLRLTRWAFQPLLAALLSDGRISSALAPATVPTEPLFFERTTADFIAKSAGLSAHARPGYVAWLSAASGAVVRIAFRDGDGFLQPVAERGLALREGSVVSRTRAWNRNGMPQGSTNELELTAPFVRCRFVQPSGLQRMLLSFATRLPGGPRWSRKLIDVWRARKGTALNQSTAAVGAGSGSATLQRRVHLREHEVQVDDTVVGAVNIANLSLEIQGACAGLPLARDAAFRVPLSACGATISPRGIQCVRVLRCEGERVVWERRAGPST
jgi:hypothetical protein